MFAVLAVFLFQLITKKWLQKWGELRQIHEGFLIQKTQEGISGSKEAKILGKELIDKYPDDPKIRYWYIVNLGSWGQIMEF